MSLALVDLKSAFAHEHPRVHDASLETLGAVAVAGVRRSDVLAEFLDQRQQLAVFGRTLYGRTGNGVLRKRCVLRRLCSRRQLRVRRVRVHLLSKLAANQ